MENAFCQITNIFYYENKRNLPSHIGVEAFANNPIPLDRIRIPASPNITWGEWRITCEIIPKADSRMKGGYKQHAGGE